MQIAESIPPMPPIGRSEEWYASRIRHADQERNSLLHESLKVGQYISLGMGAGIPWTKKERYFEHAIHRHGQPPLDASETVATFYEQLRQLVQRHAGEEACRLVSRQDDTFTQRIRLGEPQGEVRIDALTFFNQVLGDQHRKPDHFHYDDWHAIMVVRNAWM